MQNSKAIFISDHTKKILVKVILEIVVLIKAHKV